MVGSHNVTPWPCPKIFPQYKKGEEEEKKVTFSGVTKKKERTNEKIKTDINIYGLLNVMEKNRDVFVINGKSLLSRRQSFITDSRVFSI